MFFIIVFLICLALTLKPKETEKLIMSKLFKLKEWLTIDETALHLSGVLGETVEKKDVYRLALDGYLQISVNLVNHAEARLGKIVGKDDVTFHEASSNLTEFLRESEGLNVEMPLMVMGSLKIDEENYINLDDNILSISGIWDLLMCGNEALDIEHFYQQCINGVEVTLTAIDGAFIKRENKVAQLMDDYDDNEFKEGSKAHLKEIEKHITKNKVNKTKADKLRKKYKLKRKEYLKIRSLSNNEDNYYPAAGLPHDSVLVVRTKAIMDFIQSLDESPKEQSKPLTSKERNSLLVLIAALCKDAGIDYNQRGIATSLEKMTEILGAPVTDDTIRNILKQIDDAVSLRSK